LKSPVPVGVSRRAHKNTLEASLSEHGHFAIALSIARAIVFDEHAICPKFIFVWKPFGIHDGCGNEVGPGRSNVWHTRQQLDRLVEVRIAFENSFII